MKEPYERVATTNRPGATTSGFVKPAAVGPRADQSAMLSSVSEPVPLSSKAPTVMTSGSSAGLRIFPDVGPALPAATTTTTPSRHRRSTAKLSGSTFGSWVDGTPQERFRTRMLYWLRYAPTQCIACSTVETSTAALRPATFTAMTLARGATPV